MATESASAGELLEVAGGNLEACFFLLGYVSGDVPPGRRAQAIEAWKRHRQEATAYELVMRERFAGFERPFE